MKLAARIFTTFLLLVTCYLLLVVAPVSAQTNPYATTNTNPDVPKNLHTWTQTVMLEVVSAMTCQLTGIDPINTNQKCLGIDQKTGQIGFVDPQTSSGGGGAIGMMGGLIAATYTPPLHTSDYFAYLGENFGIAKKAYAQGIGFRGLTPLSELWSTFRNIVYLLFVIVFVVVGFAIMLRVKIDPRTVMTIENQIPKIIIAIILVTFSFAIAGFVIDMMYVAIFVLINIIGSADPNVASDITKIASATNPIEAANSIGGLGISIGGDKGITQSAAEAVGGLIGPLVDNPPGRIITGFVMGMIGRMVTPIATSAAGGLGAIGGAIAGAFAGGPAGILLGAKIGGTIGTVLQYLLPATGAVSGTLFSKEIVGTFASLIAFLIITIAMLYALIRLWFQLIIAYVYFLLDVVLAPFWILGGLFPGSPIGFGPWMREILANLSAFPVTIGLFLIGRVFIDMFGRTSTTEKFFVPPLIGHPADPANPNLIGSLIGLGIILMAPMAVNMTRDLFKPPPFKYSAAIGQAFGVGAGVTNVPKHAMSIGQLMYYREHYFKHIPILGGLLGPKEPATPRPAVFPGQVVP